MVALAKRSLFGRRVSASASKEFSRCTPRSLTTSTSSNAVASGERSFTTFVDYVVRPHASVSATRADKASMPTLPRPARTSSDRMMRIAIDAHTVGSKLGGNESYAVNLIESLAEIDSINQYTIYVTTNEARERFSSRWPNFKVRSTLPHTPLIRIPLTLSAELRKNPVDVLHVQFTAPPFCPCPVVVSIHDLSFEHLPQTFNRRSRTQLRLTVRHSARRAARILSLSEHTRRDIIETYGISPQRVTAIPLAAPDHFGPIMDNRELQRVRHNYGIDGEYILSVGSIQPRKNLAR